MTDYKCYLPFRGEFGWYLVAHVKKFHGDNHPNKIACIKKGHECLFPTATEFFYDWNDIPDNHKAGVSTMNDEETIKQNVQNLFSSHQIDFISPSEINHDTKHTFYQHTFIPQAKHNFGLRPDVVLAPRKRVIDAHRNWTQDKWQIVTNVIKSAGFKVGVCGNRETSFELINVDYKSYDYIDVDSDVEMMNNAKLVIAQESGLLYLSFLCERPTFCIDHYHDVDMHRNPNPVFKKMGIYWHDPHGLGVQIANFLKG